MITVEMKRTPDPEKGLPEFIVQAGVEGPDAVIALVYYFLAAGAGMICWLSRSEGVVSLCYYKEDPRTGDCKVTHSFSASGEEGEMLRAFHDHFVFGCPGDHSKVAVMLRNGIYDEVDIKAGLRVNDPGRLVQLIAASKESLVGLRFFVHPDD